MPDVSSVEVIPIGNFTPHSIGVGNAGKMWVTTSSKCIVRIDPGNKMRTEIKHGAIPELSAGVMKDPLGRQKIWFAAPAPPNDPDPIMEMETTGSYVVTVYPLENNAKAESITLQTTEIPSTPTPITQYTLLFAEPENKYVGMLAIPNSGGVIDVISVEPNTWLWDVAVTTAADKQTHTYWVTGQQRTNNPPRAENGLYRRSPETKTWQRIMLPRGTAQKPFYVKADTSGNIWVTATSPNQVLRYNPQTATWRQQDLGDAVPQQMTFAPTGEVWVASSKGLHQFDRELSGPGSMVDVAGGAKGICIGSDGKLWYTNPTQKNVGRFALAAPVAGQSSRIGRTQVTYQGEYELQEKEHVDRPLVVEYVANGRPVPGIPLTCRLEAEGATFDDNTRERVILTDQRGQVVVPPVYAGDIEEEAVLSVGLGDTEIHATSVLNIKPA